MKKRGISFVLLVLILLFINLFVYAENGDTDGTPGDDDTPPTDDDTPPTDDDIPPTDDPFDQDSGDSDDEDTWDSSPSESEDAVEKIYGCWNSQPIGSGETIMNIQFDVDYEEETTMVVNYPIDVKVEYRIKTVEIELLNLFRREYDYDIDIDLEEDPYRIYTEIKDIDWGDYLAGTKIFYVNETLSKYNIIIGPSTAEKIPVKELNYFNTPILLKKIELYRSKLLNPLLIDEEYVEEGHGSIDINKRETNDNYNIFLYDPLENKRYDDNDDDRRELVLDLEKEKTVIYLMAELNEELTYLDNYNIFNIPNPVSNNKTLTYSCAEEECLYPLPGQPHYAITNHYPDLYELYFVYGEADEDQQLITGTFETDDYGNIIAKKVSQQVLYLNKIDESGAPVQEFYGCQAPSFLNTTSNEGHCSIKGAYSCAYSEVHEVVGSKEKYTTINTWSDKGINEVGYKPITSVDQENVTLFYNTYPLEFKPDIFLATERNYSASVVAARNFLSNAEFKPSGQELPHWEIIKGDVYVKNEFEFTKNKKVISLQADEILRSEQIAVENDKFLHFTQNQSAYLNVIRVDKEGKQLPAISMTGNDFAFNTANAAYLILEFVGPGEVEFPMLQFKDELGEGSYNYDPVYEDRSAVACCPYNYCWNGHHCVEPMTKLTNLVEQVEEGRYYRCLEGQWEHLPVARDWNDDHWGFCAEDDQCFVLRKTLGASSENTAQSFYDGDYPTCINDTEYIFDNYCDAGNWTSRTKVMATKLLEVAEGDDYVLYCTNYRDVLVELDMKDNYLGGGISQSSDNLPSLSEATGEEVIDEMINTCFDKIIDDQGTRLVEDKDNSCINNMCILRYKQGGKFKVALATTLNKPIDDVNSFLLSLGDDLSSEDIDELCSGGTGDNFIECDLSDLSIEGDLLYTNNIQGIIYSKEGISVNPNVWDKIMGWFGDLFGLESELSNDNNFVNSAQNFRELYILNKDNKNVRVMREIYPGVKEMLVGEYEGFETPVCDYVNQLILPEDLQTEDLEKLSNMNKLSCNNETQRIELVGGLDFFWSKLTGQLRVGEMD